MRQMNLQIKCNSKNSFYLNRDDIQEAYFADVRQFPILDEKEEHDLLYKVQNGKTKKEREDAKKRLVECNLRFVISIAKKLGNPDNFLDLVNEGNIGLMKAVKRFNPNNGARLVTFAMTWIKSEIQEYVLRNWRLVKVATTKSQRKLFFNLRKLKDDTKLLGTSEAEKIAETLDVKPAEVFEMEKRMLGSDVEIDEPSGGAEEGTAPSEWLTDERDTPENTIARGVYENTIENRLPEAVKKLDDRSRRIIEARWLYNDQDGSKGATLADLAKEMGVSQERVRQLEKKAFATLKTYLKEDKDV